MSTTEKAIGALKSVLLMNERFDALDGRIDEMGGRLERLALSHADLAQRVSSIEGYLKAATRTPFGDTPRIEER
jgi:hypothetical protein